MADINSQDFKDWCTEKKIEYSSLSDSDKARTQKDFDNFQDWLRLMGTSYSKLPNDNTTVTQFENFKTWLEHSKNNTFTKEYDKFTNDRDKASAWKQCSADFFAFAKEKGYDKDALDKLERDKYVALMEEFSKSLIPSMTVHQHNNNGNQDQNTDNSWIDEKIKSWDNEWCQDTSRNYKFERVEADISPNTLKFDIYKTDEDKANGKKAVTVHYNNPRDVTLETADGKAPDFEFFDKMVREAKEVDQVPGVTFEGEMTDDFKAKLALACIKHGLPMTGFEGKIDVSQLGTFLTDSERAVLGKDGLNKVKYYNAKIDAQVHLANSETKDKPFDLSAVTDINDAAILYAAFTKAGVQVDGVEKVTKNTHGAFLTQDLNYFPDEARSLVVDFNAKARQKQIEGIRERLDENIMSGDQDALNKRIEREDIAQARDNIHTAKKEGRAVSDADKQIIQNRINAQKTRG